MKFIQYFTVALSIVLSIPSLGQKDSTDSQESSETSTRDPRAFRATIYSTVLPGLGQAYNTIGLPANQQWKWLKIPVIYGLGGYFTYNIFNNHQSYTGYRDALFNREDEDPNTVDTEFTRFSDTQLRTLKNITRRRRDVNIIYVSFLYVFNIIDANVEAHLREFEVNENLIMSWEPTLIPAGSLPNRSIGLTLNFKFL